MKNLREMEEYLESCGIVVCGTTNEFYGGDPDEEGQGLWVAAEYDDEGLYFNYYTKSTEFEGGVHRGLRALANSWGYYWGWNDPGTIMLWPI